MSHSHRRNKPESSNSDFDLENFDLNEASKEISESLEQVHSAALEQGVIEPLELAATNELDTNKANSDTEDTSQNNDGTANDSNVDEVAEDVKTGVVLLFSKNCLNCKHLCPDAAKEIFTKCHYTKGNENCPAKEVKFVISLPHESIARKLLRAHLSNDASRLSDLMARLNRSDKLEVKKCMEFYTKLLVEATSTSEAD